MASLGFDLGSFYERMMPFKCLGIEDRKVETAAAPIAFGAAHCKDIMLIESGGVLALGFIFGSFDY